MLVILCGFFFTHIFVLYFNIYMLVHAYKADILGLFKTAVFEISSL